MARHSFVLLGARNKPYSCYSSEMRTDFALFLPIFLISTWSPAPSAAPPAGASTLHLPAMVVASSEATIKSAGVGVGASQPVPIARLSRGVPIEVTASGPDGALSVRVHGGIEVTGVVPRDALGVVVCEPGPLGDHFYAGRGNVLSLRSEVVGGRVQVAGEVRLLSKTDSKAIAAGEQYHRVPFQAELEERRLCTEPLRKHSGTDEDPEVAYTRGEIALDDFPADTRFIDVVKGAALKLLDRPLGTPLHERGGDRWGYMLARIEHQGKWDRVAAGDGPYLLGWISARPTLKSASYGGLLGAFMSAGPAPARLNSDALLSKPLHELPAGAELRQFGVVVARLTRPGYARICATREGWKYVVGAVDDEVVAEGWIDPARIGPQVKEEAKP